MLDNVLAIGTSPEQGASPITALMPIILIFVIFYFLLIRPQQTQQKKHRELLSQLKKNDEVVTNSGIHGTIVNLDEETVTLRVDDNTRIKFQKNTISYVKKKTG